MSSPAGFHICRRLQVSPAAGLLDLLPRAARAQEIRDGSADTSAVRDDRLQAQLASLRYSFTSRGQLKVASKEEMRDWGLPSPDRADALALAFAADAVPPGP